MPRTNRRRASASPRFEAGAVDGCVSAAPCARAGEAVAPASRKSSPPPRSSPPTRLPASRYSGNGHRIAGEGNGGRPSPVRQRTTGRIRVHRQQKPGRQDRGYGMSASSFGRSAFKRKRRESRPCGGDAGTMHGRRRPRSSAACRRKTSPRRRPAKKAAASSAAVSLFFPERPVQTEGLSTEGPVLRFKETQHGAK